MKNQIAVYRLESGTTGVMFYDGKATRLYHRPTTASLYRLHKVVAWALNDGLCRVRPFVGGGFTVGWVMEKGLGGRWVRKVGGE